MGFFGRDKRPAVPAMSVQSGPTLDSVRALLDEIGLLRLQVKGPEMKVLLTNIAWNGELYLVRQSPDGTPSGAQLVTLTGGLQTVLSVVSAFVHHEQSVRLGDTGTTTRLADELEAVKQYAASLVAATAVTGFVAGFNADVNTGLLHRLTQDIH